VQTAAGVSATARLHDLAQEILAGVLDEAGWAPSPDELDDLHDRLAADWTDWRARPRSEVTLTERADSEVSPCPA
jgi:hypothetical protein